MISTVDTSALLELVWAAPLAVLVVTVSWGLVVRGTTRALEARRQGHSGMAVGLNALMAIVGAALFATAVVFGLIVMTTK
jgi:uncharacterized protein (DUF486 family)